MKLTHIMEVRYASKEPLYKCRNCDAQFTERHMKTRQGVKNVKYCPKCDASHHIYARTFTSQVTGNTSTVPSELQEARDHGTHPVLARVDGLVKRFDDVGSDVEKFNVKDIEAVIFALTQKYGTPTKEVDSDNPLLKTDVIVWTWPAGPADDEYHEDIMLTYFQDDSTVYLELV